MAKFHLDRIKKKFGWTGGNLRDLMQRIVETNSVAMANAVGRLTRGSFKKAAERVSTKETQFALPDVRDVLPKRSIHTRKAVERGNILTDDLRDRLTKNLRETIGKFSTSSGEPSYQYVRGERRGRTNPKLVDQFRIQATKTFKNYAKKDPKYGVPANIQAMAVTEVRSAADFIKYEYTREFLLKNTEITASKVWRHHKELSRQPRPHHMAANGMRVGFYESFKLSNGAVMRYPHDEYAPASEVISCHCDYDVMLRRLT